MNDPHDTILQRYFWDFVGRGDASAATPLFTGIHGGEALSVVIAREFHLALNDAESAIDIARRRWRYEPRHLSDDH
jgi:hypothetical protein